MTIEFDTQTPIYLQISEMLRQAILAGDIKEGEPIPSVRQISVEQNLNPQTVLNATQMLINEDLIEKRRGLGMYVQKGAREKLQRDEMRTFKNSELPTLISRAKLLGISKQELIKIIDKNFEEEH